MRCRVLPPCEFDGMIPEPLPVCSENFMTTAGTFRRNAANEKNTFNKNIKEKKTGSSSASEA